VAMKLAVSVVTVAMVGAAALPARAQAPDGNAVYQKACASCHAQPAADSRAPNPEALGQFAPESILTALTTGNMFRQGNDLSAAERKAVAEFLAGRALGSPTPLSTVGRCTTAAPPMTDPAKGSSWNGWGGTVTNTRYVPADKGGITAPLVPRLNLKWAFGFPGVTAARSQPAVVGGRLFIASESGDVYSLNAKTGCTYWMFHAQSGIRAAVSVGQYKGANGASSYGIYFADGAATAYGVDANTGKPIWTRKVDDHPFARATGSPTYYNGRVYVTMAGVGEEGQGGRPNYGCCTFRGSVTALDAGTGAVVWKTFSIAEEPKPRGKTANGTQTYGPAGGGIWAAPTIDARRRVVYVATGNGYADPQQKTTDAVLALEMDTGKIKWVAQPVPNDVWMMGCRPENPDNPNCPAKQGPDHDFSASPVLAKRTNGRDILIIQSKSGMAYGFDPDKEGALVWQYRTSGGSGLGGQWGAAVDDKLAYFGVNAMFSQNPGGMRAVKIDTGEEVWSKPASEKLCGTVRGCSAAQGAALTAVPGIVFSGSGDGGIRAYASDDGTLVWQFDTNRSFETVNGVKANGAAMDGPGAAVVDGMLYINSGYGGLVGRPGNVLLAFGVD
jgi:polyvinyl alcohol dehydrogenase (cytochrome)